MLPAKVTTTDISMKRMARQVDGNIGKYAGGGRITA
jgi:hypothetical protein